MQPPHRFSIAQAIMQLLARLQDELDQQFFFHLNQQDVRYFGKDDLFGHAIARKFKSAAADIKEAGNCLALQRPTACVFHLMRAMEVAVRQLARRPHMSITITPKTTWRMITGAMDKKIAKMPDATTREKNKKENWEEARANLHHVGSVWRNKTMHPAKSYDQEQAFNVFKAVSVFMSGLAAL
jgi:hypothetical protein